MMVTRVVTSVNGVLIAYAMATVNALLQLLFSFGVNINADQRSAVTAFVNAGLVLIAHAAHSAAKHSKSVVPAPPIDESHPGTP